MKEWQLGDSVLAKRALVAALAGLYTDQLTTRLAHLSEGPRARKQLSLVFPDLKGSTM
jgi:hypothetical protein